MTGKQADPDYQRQVKELQKQIGLQTKTLVKQISAWREFIFLASSYSHPVTRGTKDADIVLSKQHSSEFAFSHNPKTHPNTFVLFAQHSNYSWLTRIGIKCFILDKDGIILVIDNTDSYGIYISGKSVKITVSPSVYEKLRKAKLSCTQVCIGSISHKYNASSDTTNWGINDLHDQYYPIVSSFAEAKNL